MNAMQKQLTLYLTRAHSVSEIAKKFKLKIREARSLIQKGIPGFNLVEGPRNARNNRTYIAMAALDKSDTLKQDWLCSRYSSQEDQPYFEIQLPDLVHEEKVRVVLFDNVGFGAPDHDAKLFQRVLKEVEKPNTFCAFNGDIIASIQSDRRGKPEERDLAFQNRVGAFIATIKSVLHKVMWAQQGCLEREVEKRLGLDPMHYVCSEFGIPYYEQPVYVDMYWRGHLFTLQAAHGQSTSQTKGGRENSTERFSNLTGATDFVVRGHIGDAMSREKPMIVRDNSVPNLIARTQHMIVSGGFRRYWGSMAAVKGQTPTSDDNYALILYPDGGCAVKSIHNDSRKGVSDEES